jgi:CDP-diacylglycerol--glycerol-3-phosphate 3-phosphatidyltransferase
VADPPVGDDSRGLTPPDPRDHSAVGGGRTPQAPKQPARPAAQGGESPRDHSRGAPRLTFKRLVGLDRSGGPPPETRRGEALHPWTIPNAIGFVRIALIPVFLVVALRSDDGRDATAFVLFAVIAWTDYLDGMAARITGQYSRLGALLDPLTDRLLVIAGAIVAWEFELLPRWALLVLAAREVFMLGLTQVALRRGLDLNVNMLGRWAVWPTMSALGLALIWDSWVPELLLYIGLAMTLAATAVYLQDGLRAIRQGSTST